MNVGRFIFHTILAIIFALTATIGPIIIDGFMIAVIALIEIMAFIVLLIPFAGTFLFRITGIDGLADGEYVDVYLADGWLHKLIAFVMITAIASGIASLYFGIPEQYRIMLGLTIVLFMVTLSIKVDNATHDYSDRQNLFSDFLPTIMGFGIACYAVFYFVPTLPTVLGMILLCITAAVFMYRNIVALTRW